MQILAGTLDLPQRLPNAADARLPPFPEPETAPPETPTISRRDGVRIERIDRISLESGHAGQEWNITSRTNDPLSAVAELRHTQTLSRNEWQIRVETQLRVSSTRDAFRLQGSLRAFEGADEVVSSRLGSLCSSRFPVIAGDISDDLILAARLLLAALFLIFGWRKLRDFSGTVSQMVQLRAPMPVLAAGVSTFMELPVAFAIAVGAFTRPLALLMALYTLGTALDRASLLDSERCGLRRQHGQLLQKPQHYRRLLAAVHHWRRKIFDRCIVRHRHAVVAG